MPATCAGRCGAQRTQKRLPAAPQFHCQDDTTCGGFFRLPRRPEVDLGRSQDLRHVMSCDENVMNGLVWIQNLEPMLAARHKSFTSMACQNAYDCDNGGTLS